MKLTNNSKNKLNNKKIDFFNSIPNAHLVFTQLLDFFLSIKLTNLIEGS